MFEVGTNSFISIAEADAYWADRNGTEWADTSTEEKQAALIDATDYLNYAYQWPGTIAEDNQSLSWPRVDAYDLEGRELTGIPPQITSATAYLAGQAASGTLLFEVRGPNEKRLKAGSVEIEYQDGSSSQPVYDYLKSILSVITYTGSSQIKLVRS